MSDDILPLPVFAIIYDPAVLKPDDYDALVRAIGDLVRACGGEGIKLISSKTAEEPPHA